MKILIIEDEHLAAERMTELVKQYDADTIILGVFDSVQKTVNWLNENPTPDLILMDIQLADGLSFEIFEQVTVESPVIFTTAFDEYAIKAFKVNSVDYLLKPISFEDLSQAMGKFNKLQAKKTEEAKNQGVIYEKVFQMLTKEYKSRFVIKVGEHIKSIPAENIQCFYSMEKASFLQSKDNHHYAIDYSLDQLETLVDPVQFFRINRKFIIRMDSIKDIIAYTNSRLKLKLQHDPGEELIVARERVKEFKKWLEG